MDLRRLPKSDVNLLSSLKKLPQTFRDTLDRKYVTWSYKRRTKKETNVRHEICRPKESQGTLTVRQGVESLKQVQER